jgi:tetratricopeptide (TPR) repeat protein
MKAAGNWRGAFEHYVKAQRLLLMQNTNYHTGIDDIMRFDIAQVAEILPKLRPPPSLPAEADRHSRRAVAILESAVSDRDNDRAANEFGQAIYEAPWIPRLYLNRGLIYAKAGYPEAAAADMKRYLAFDPTVADAPSVRQKIGALDILSEARKPWYRYLNSWSMESGAVETITLRDRRLIVALAWPAKTDRRTPGTVLCSGTVDGRTFHGTCFDYMTSADDIKCFGEKIETEADGAIDSSGNLVVRYRGRIHYNTQSCRIDSQDWMVYRTYPAAPQ